MHNWHEVNNKQPLAFVARDVGMSPDEIYDILLLYWLFYDLWYSIDRGQDATYKKLKDSKHTNMR